MLRVTVEDPVTSQRLPKHLQLFPLLVVERILSPPPIPMHLINPILVAVALLRGGEGNDVRRRRVPRLLQLRLPSFRDSGPSVVGGHRRKHCCHFIRKEALVPSPQLWMFCLNMLPLWRPVSKLASSLKLFHFVILLPFTNHSIHVE